MAALFESTAVEQTKRDESHPLIFIHKSKVGYALGKNKAILSELLPIISKEHTYHIPSFGSFSTHIAIEHVVGLIGPCEVTLTSWAISEQAVRSLLNLIAQGIITRLTCLFDERVKTYAPNAYQLANHSISEIKLGKCHAKITVLTNDKFSVVINSSANLSLNRRIEAFVFTENEDLAKFYKSWIQHICQDANPF
jgi:hypothetical protein